MAKSGFAHRVARQRKSPELLPVDEAAEQENHERYFRLDPERGVAEEREIVRLDATNEPAQRLAVPVRDNAETRSHQPGIETLIDAELAALEGLEEAWGKASSERRPLPWGWFALIALILAGGATWSLRHVIFAEEQLEIIRGETQSILETEESSVEEARGLIQRIESTLRAFCAAPDIETMSYFVRHADRVRPLMDAHYARQPFEPVGPFVIETLRPLTLGTHGDFWAAKLRLRNGREQNLIMQAGDTGKTLVDWETAVNYQPMAWDDYARERPAGSTMDFRVYLEPDSLYTHEFRNPSQWNCYMLTALDSEEMLFGYVRAGSPTAQLLRTWFQRNRAQRASMILRLSIPEGLASPRGVVIDEALSVRWIYIASPDGGA